MRTNIGCMNENNFLSACFCQNTSFVLSSLGFRSSAELTARLLRTNITKLDILESDMIMRTVAAGLPDAF